MGQNPVGRKLYFDLFWFSLSRGGGAVRFEAKNKRILKKNEDF